MAKSHYQMSEESFDQYLSEQCSPVDPRNFKICKLSGECRKSLLKYDLYKYANKSMTPKVNREWENLK